MMTHQGIAVDSYVTFVKDCTVKARAFRDEIEVTLGHATGSLHLFTDEAGLAKLVQVSSEALAQLRAVPESGMVDFEVANDRS